MSRLSNIERSIERLRVTTTAAVDERILGDAFAALEESVQIEWAKIRPSAWQLIVRSRITKLAAAAVIVIVVLVGVKFITRPGPKPPGPPITVVEAEKKQINAMAAAGDIDGLVRMLSTGQFASKVLAAEYLGDIGDQRALPELERLYIAAEEELPEGYTENPFAEPVERIKSRIEPEPGEDVVGTEPNKVTLIDVNEGTPTEADEAVVREANEIAEANVPAETEGALDFFVVHKESNEPVVGVNLDIKIQREGPDDKRKAVTNEKGFCRIDVGDLETRYIRIEVRKEQFVPVDAWFRKGEDAVRIEIPKSYTVALEPGTCIGGFVQNEQAEAIEGATVYMRASGGKRTEIERVTISDHTEKTDANGFWQCDIMPAKLDDISIRLEHSDYIDDESYYARSAPAIEELREMTGIMVMKRGVDVVGTVIDLMGQPIAKAGVKQGTEGWGVKYARTETDAEGRFEFKATKPGTLLLTVQAKGHAPDLKEIMVREGMRPVEFRLGPSQTILGQLVDSQDKPIEGVDVSVESWRGRQSIKWQTKSDSKGYFAWNGAPKDEVYFRFAKKGYMPLYALALSSSVDEHIIVMCRALRVSGEVVAADSNEPIGEFKLILGTKRAQDDAIRWDLGSAKTLAGGRYEAGFDEPRYGYFVRIEAAGYAPAISRMVTEEEEEVAIDFVLHRGEKPSGTVYLADGEPAVGAEVALLRAGFFGARVQNGRFVDKGEQDFVVTGPDGQFSLPPQAERYLLVVLHDEGYAEITDDELAMDPNIFIEPWACVEGVVCVGGKTGPNETIAMDYYRRYEPNLPWLSFNYRTETDANGNFALERVVPGKVRVVHYFISSRRRTAVSHAEVVEVIAGETARVTIGGKGRPIVGRLLLPADCNRPVNWSNAIVTLAVKLPGPPRPEDFNEMIEPEKRAWSKSWRQSEEGKAYTKMEWEKARSYGVRIEQDGTFRADDVPAGTYQLQVTLGEAPGRAWWWGRTPGSSVEPLGFTGTLTHEFEVPDMNEVWSDEPLDLGSLEIEIESVLMVGDTAAGFEAETFNGNEIELADYSGKVVVVTFWFASQLWSTQKLLEMDEIYNAFSKDERFVMIGVSLDSDIDAARKLVEDNKLKWINCYLSRERRVSVCKDYEIERHPSTFVIGPDGKIFAKDPSSLLLKSVLEEALRQE